MPKLGNTPTKKVYLPSTKDEPNEADRAWVEIRSKLLLGFVGEAAAADGDFASAVSLLTSCIADWNFTEDGTPDTPKLPVTTENINQLELKDFNFLAEEIQTLKSAAESGLSKPENLASTASLPEAVDTSTTSKTSPSTITNTP